jgi:UDP-glucose 4-epimerase
MSSLIVGSRGFIGSSLSSHVNQSNLVLIDSEASLKEFAQIKRKIQFNNVYWLAGRAKPSTVAQGPIELHSDFVSLSTFLSNTYIQFERFFFLSSGGCVYGPDSGPFHERSETFAINQYGEIKLLCEKLLIETLKEKSVILRVSNIHGINQAANKSQGIIPHWLADLKDKRPLKIYGSFSDYRDYLSVDDLIRAIMKITELTTVGIFNIGSGEKLSINDVLESFTKVLGYRPSVELFPRRQGDRAGYVLDISKAKEFLGWTPLHSSHLSISATIEVLLQKFQNPKS